VADGTFERTPSEPGLDQTTPKQGPKPPLLFNVSLRIDPLGHVPNRSYLTLFGSNPKRDIKQKGGFDPLRDMSQTGHLGPNPKRDIKQKGGFDPLRDMSPDMSSGTSHRRDIKQMTLLSSL
jgi:hypothetical protein